jgi:hypothetical protein
MSRAIFRTLMISLSLTSHSRPPPSTISLPAALPLFPTGSRRDGLSDWRRKRKNAAANRSLISKLLIGSRRDRREAVFPICGASIAIGRVASPCCDQTIIDIEKPRLA